MNNKTAATKETTKRAMAKPSQAKPSQTKKIIISIFKKNAKRDSVHAKRHFLKRKYEEAKRQNKNQKPSQAKPSQAKPSQAKPSQAKPSQAKRKNKLFFWRFVSSYFLLKCGDFHLRHRVFHFF